MILGTKNTSAGPKTDIGGPCPNPYINITFWGDFFSPRGRKPGLEWKNAIWAGIWSFFCLGAISVVLGGSETSVFL